MGVPAFTIIQLLETQLYDFIIFIPSCSEEQIQEISKFFPKMQSEGSPDV